MIPALVTFLGGNVLSLVGLAIAVCHISTLQRRHAEEIETLLERTRRALRRVEGCERELGAVTGEVRILKRTAPMNDNAGETPTLPTRMDLPSARLLRG